MTKASNEVKSKSEVPSPAKPQDLESLIRRKTAATQLLTLVKVGKPKIRPQSVNKGRITKQESLKISTMESYDLDEEDANREAQAATIKRNHYK